MIVIDIIPEEDWKPGDLALLKEESPGGDPIRHGVKYIVTRTAWSQATCENGCCLYNMLGLFFVGVSGDPSHCFAANHFRKVPPDFEEPKAKRVKEPVPA